jgi:hypothetical protein
VDLGTYAIIFLVGACALALWFYYRMVACQLLAPAVSALLRGTDIQVLRVVSVVGVSLPALVYAMLATIWVIALIQATLRSGMLR